MMRGKWRKTPTTAITGIWLEVDGTKRYRLGLGNGKQMRVGSEDSLTIDVQVGDILNLERGDTIEVEWIEEDKR